MTTNPWDDPALSSGDHPLAPGPRELALRSRATVRSWLAKAARYGADTPKGRTCLAEARAHIHVHNAMVRLYNQEVKNR